MKRAVCTYVLIFSVSLTAMVNVSGQNNRTIECNSKNSINVMYEVHDYFESQEWRNIDRNWIRSTYYIGLMSFYKITKDTNLLLKAKDWGSKHGWKTGSEWIYPANRLTCSQVYIELFEIYSEAVMISRTKKFMDRRILNPAPAAEQGWDYIDAAFVGAPAYVLMTKVTGDLSYLDYANKIMSDMVLDLYDQEESLFYRDQKAKNSRNAEGNKSIWARGNGWIFACLPRLMKNMHKDESSYSFYESLLVEMSKSLINKQRADGLWSPNLGETDEFDMPESSASAFFVFGLAWGINNDILPEKDYLQPTLHAWNALINLVDENGKVNYGQGVARKPEKVNKNDWHEYVSGAFLMAGSEMLKLCKKTESAQ